MATRPAIGLFSPGDRGVLAPTDALGCPKLVGTTGTPTVSVSGVTNAAASITGNDIAGLITVTLPAVALLATLTITVTPTSAYPSAPNLGFTSYGTANLFNLYSTGNLTIALSATTSWAAQVSVPVSVGGTVKFSYQAIC